MHLTVRWVGVVVLASLLASGNARAQVASKRALERAKSQYRALEFERCQRTLEGAKQSQLPNSELAEVELYAGLCAYGLGNHPRALDHFKVALTLNPEAKLPPMSSPKIVSLFESAARAQSPRPPPPSLAPAPDPAPVPSLNLTAQPAPSTARASGRSQVWTVVLGSTAALAVADFTFFGLRSRAQANDARSAHFWEDAQSRASSARTSATVANVGLGVAGVALSGLVVHLWLSRTEDSASTASNAP